MTQPTFETNRLTLRPMRPDDRESVVKIFADPESSRYLTRDMSDPVTAVAGFERWLGQAPGDGTGTWLMDLAGTAVGVGRLTHSVRLPGNVVEAGWFVARAHVGQGYATEAVRVLIDHATRTLGLAAVWALIYHGNEPSIRLARSMGFLDVAEFSQPAGEGRVQVLLGQPGGFAGPQPTIRTERLVIRPLRGEDRQDAIDVFPAEQMVHYLSGDKADGWVGRMMDRRIAFDGPDGMGHWVFVEDDVMVGIGHLRPSHQLPGAVAEIGWYLGVEHQGRGLAAEAAAALRDHGLHTLKVPAVWALVHERNVPSARLAERLGFLDVGSGTYYGGPHRVQVALPRTATR
ncbi:GNAT family N-acetyltransferase [Actinocrispum wychmicini]|uniref:RimJ/RimL family protein N-acetyltransferase n=1 Tax=Actinocrispum wychmicini TaxID=1213861 RepID=A0A4R2IZL7_9PSEU|nr:GNAT family N-acetyltransferase [Actinocrispum wychmicini]TCO49878.1 RimJ/RimL family protein N-acetyltransferase [Actinocrispum wychmicini]